MVRFPGEGNCTFYKDAAQGDGALREQGPDGVAAQEIGGGNGTSETMTHAVSPKQSSKYEPAADRRAGLGWNL